MSQAGFVTRGSSRVAMRPSASAPARSWDRLRERALDLYHHAIDGARILGWMPTPAAMRPKLIIQVRSIDVALWKVDPGDSATIISVAPHTGVDFGDHVADAIALTGAADDTIAMACDDHLVLDLALDLPIAPTPHLERDIVTFIQNQTPFAPGEGLAFWTIERSDWTHAHVDIALLPVSHMAPVLAALAGLNVRPAVAVRDPETPLLVARPAWLMAVSPTPGQRWRAMTPLQRVSLLAAVIVATSLATNVAATVLSSWALGERAEQARVMEARAAKSLTDMRLLSGRQRDTMARVRVLDQMAERLPDSTWLDRLELKENKLEIVGFAPSAADTLKIISTIPGVRNAELTASVTRDATQNIERFRLSADVGEGGKP